MSTQGEETIDMQKNILVHLMDDDSNIITELKRRLPSVCFETLSIDTIVKYVDKQIGGRLKKTDLIFIDTFYKDDKSDYYALDFFESYRQINSETKRETEGKHYVLVSIDEVNERLNNQTSKDIDAIDEKQRLMSLMGKVRMHPYIEWGSQKGSKIDKIIEVIEKYAQKNKIYLYRKERMSFDEWINYLICLIDKTQALIGDIQGTNIQNANVEISSIIESLSDSIARAKEKLNLDSDEKENNYGGIKTFENAIDFTEKYNREVSKQVSNLMKTGAQYNNQRLMDLAHHFINLNLATSMKIYSEKKAMKKDQEKAD